MNEQSEICIRNSIFALSGLYGVIRTDEFKEIYGLLLATINTNGKIIITGVGKNSHVAAKISDTMASLGIPSMYLDTVHYFHGNAGYINKNDAVINISRSGTTDEIVDLISHLKINMPSVATILIHCNPDIGCIGSDYGLFCGHVQEGDEFNLAPTASTSVLLCLLDCISVQLSKDIGFTEQNFLKFHPGGNLGKTLKDKL